MQIFIMRHGEAENFALSDADRALTDKGKNKSKMMAAWLAKQINTLDLVLVSPYKRAQETWQNCEPLLPPAKKVLIEDGITPFGDSEQVATYIKALITIENPSSILIISHLPLVNYLSEEFCLSSTDLIFPPSAVCQIEFDSIKSAGEVISLQTPKNQE